MHNHPARHRLLFCSYHCLVDSSSGAALATQDLLGLLPTYGWECRALCGPQLDFEQGESIRQLLCDRAISVAERSTQVGPMPFTLFHARWKELPITIFEPAATRQPRPGREERTAFLAVVERMLDRDKPDAVLTYGGHWVTRPRDHQLRLAARHSRGLPAAHFAYDRAWQRGIRVVFQLHNFAYRPRRVPALA
jgi:hypothetical protein